MKDNGDDSFDNFKQELWHGLMEKSSYHSLNCYFQFLSTSTRYWELLMITKFEDILNNAEAQWALIEASRADLISHTGNDAKTTWETPAEGELSEENLAKYRAEHQKVI